MSKIIKFISLILFLSSSVSYANINSLDMTQTGTKKILPKNLSLFALAATGGTVSKEETVEGLRSTSLRLIPTYAFGKHSLSADFSMIQRTDFLEFSTSDLDLSWNFPMLKLMKNTNVMPILSVTLPASETNIKDNSYRGSVWAGGMLTSKLFPISWPVQVIYFATGGTNAHLYKTNNLNEFNNQYFLDHLLLLRKTFGQVRIGLTGGFSPRWDYAGSYDPRYVLAQNISYLHKGFRFGLTHSNRGVAQNYRGSFENVKVFDDYSSRLSLSVSYTLN